MYTETHFPSVQAPHFQAAASEAPCTVYGPEALLKQLARSDRRAAVELMVRRYQPRLLVHASGILHDEAEARAMASAAWRLQGGGLVSLW